MNPPRDGMKASTARNYGRGARGSLGDVTQSVVSIEAPDLPEARVFPFGPARHPVPALFNVTRMFLLVAGNITFLVSCSQSGGQGGLHNDLSSMPEYGLLPLASARFRGPHSWRHRDSSVALPYLR